MSKKLLQVTSEGDLKQIGIKDLKLRYFDVFALDEIPKKLRANQCGIINSGKRDSDGQIRHWTCFYNNSKLKYVLYFDPFGLSPDERIKHMLHSSGKKVMVNTTQFQDLRAESCGYWCLHFLKEVQSGKSMVDVLSTLSGSNQKQNEKKLEQKF